MVYGFLRSSVCEHQRNLSHFRASRVDISASSLEIAMDRHRSRRCHAYSGLSDYHHPVNVVVLTGFGNPMLSTQKSHSDPFSAAGCSFRGRWMRLTAGEKKKSTEMEYNLPGFDFSRRTLYPLALLVKRHVQREGRTCPMLFVDAKATSFFCSIDPSTRRSASVCKAA
ncbi:hypothetical protein KP509_08G029600 [Ceratopteris richardii]|uniref:Uncharacterized protein n=1 Tax=Ceratopteris richardii TaxID=49495 RepID=A0A8T2UBC6_CERRI|nr:hypothetical protein KP509_08G029600 [Ceratopteris richardii]